MSVAATIVDGPAPPLIVFAMAFDEHALHAFELAALDYVRVRHVKPFDEWRLAQTVVRIRRALERQEHLAQRQAVLREYLERAAPGGGLAKVWGERENENLVLVGYRDVLRIVAVDKKDDRVTAGLLRRQFCHHRMQVEHLAA